MSLQDTFYILGIIFMTISLVILIGLVILVFYIKNKITYIHDQIEDRINDVNEFTIKPVKKAVDLAASFISKRSGAGRKKS